MSLKRTVQYWRIGFIAISIMMLLSVSGCSDTHLEDEQVVESEIAVQDQQQNVKDNEDEIIEICSQLYKKASEENKIADLETVRIIVNQFGENGYPAVDSRNQINMTEPENRYFCFLLCIHLFAEFHYLLWFRHVNLISAVNCRITIFSKTIYNTTDCFQIR